MAERDLEKLGTLPKSLPRELPARSAQRPNKHTREAGVLHILCLDATPTFINNEMYLWTNWIVVDASGSLLQIKRVISQSQAAQVYRKDLETW
ncbi:hypothetical protein COCOBI_16-0560 [Coccomyxa sp. Obi]|nr:hypothetical protein COCOBI_16-0560 [Coccomyxa sp. Obi]